MIRDTHQGCLPGRHGGVGGNQADESAFKSRAVYVFRRTGTSWAQEAYLKASNTGADDWFGTSVALSGDTPALPCGALQATFLPAVRACSVSDFGAALG